MNKIKLTTLALITCTALSGCAGMGVFEKPTLQTQIPQTWASNGSILAPYDGSNWVENFNDAQLSMLVAEAVYYNYDLQATAANLEKSRAQAKKAGANLYPAVNLSAQAARSGDLESRASDASQFGVSLDVSWEADVWGRIRAGADAAEYDYYAAEHDYKAAKHSLAAQTAKAYFLAVETTKQLELAQNFESILNETLEVTDAFYQEGFLSLQDIHLVKADLARAKESVQNAHSTKLSALRSLEVLLGRYPAADLESGSAFPVMPDAMPAGVPSEALERRPDIRAAERRVAAAFKRIDAAEAAKLPAISLTGSLGASSAQLATLTDPVNLLWNVAGSALFPIFNAGALDADVDIRTAEQKAAIANYQQTALNTFSEVEAALSNEVLYRERQQNLDDAYENAKSAEIIADENFKAGEIELLDLLQIKRSTISAQISQIRAQRELIDQRVNLHLGLGGSVEENTSLPTAKDIQAN